MSAFPFTLGPLGNSFPLNTTPYWSRITLSQIQGTTASNYCLLGFKPGLPLQASELNEIQEIAVMNQTLTATMISSWPVFNMSWKNEVYGPGWDGTTPIYPKFDGKNTIENLVASDDKQVFVRKGWYLVTVNESNLKHWVYLNQGYTSDISVSTIPNGSQNEFGFIATYETIKPTDDPSLYDNSSGSVIPNLGAPAGADRIRVKLSDPVWAMNGNTANFSPILKKIDTDDNLLLYMNNVEVPQE